MKKLFLLVAAAMLIGATAFAQTPLNAPTTVGQPLAEGSYILNSNLDFKTNYYTAASSMVSIQLNGYTITGTSTSGLLRLEGASLTIDDSKSTGAINATTGRAIYNNSTGSITISGGTVSATDGVAIYNYDTGSITISGGTVSATDGRAIYNDSKGKISIGQAAGNTTLITSANTSAGGTIVLAGRTTNDVLDITGGTVQNTSTGNAIYSNGTGSITISGGTVSTTSGRAIFNYNEGNVTISGGTVSATTGSAIYNNNTGSITISGGTVSATDGRVIYNSSTGNVTISGGTVSATTGSAIHNVSNGKITISQAAGKTTLITSACVDNNSTIYLTTNNTSTIVLKITGGTVQNTATPEGYSVYYSDAAITYPLLANVYSHTSGTVGRVYPHPHLLTVVKGVGIAATTPATGLQVANKEVEITATAATGYTFSIWTVTSGSGSFGSATTATTTYTMPNETATIQANATANNDVSYTVNYIKQGTTTELATAKTVTGKTFDETYSEDAVAITGYTVVSNPQNITLDAYGKTLTFEYTVNSYTVTFVQPENGTLTVKDGDAVITSGTAVPSGTVLTITATPNTGYSLESLKVNDVVNTSGSYTVTAATTIVAMFKVIPANTFVVTFVQPENGTLTVKDGDVVITSGTAVPSGTVLTITTTPASGYSLESLKVNDVVNTSGSYTVTAATTIVAMFKVIPANTFVVTFVQPENGTLTVKDGDAVITSVTAVPSGTVLTITTTPASGYSLESLKVNGVVNTSGSYTVTAATTIVATFKIGTGIFDLKVAELKLYPNPAKDKLIIENVECKIETVEIFDMMGRLVLQTPFTSVIDISALPKGIYTVKVGSYRGKIMKN